MPACGVKPCFNHSLRFTVSVTSNCSSTERSLNQKGSPICILSGGGLNLLVQQRQCKSYPHSINKLGPEQTGGSNSDEDNCGRRNLERHSTIILHK